MILAFKAISFTYKIMILSSVINLKRFYTRFLQTKQITSTQQRTGGCNGQKKIFRLFCSCYSVFSLWRTHFLLI